MSDTDLSTIALRDDTIWMLNGAPLRPGDRVEIKVHMTAKRKRGTLRRQRGEDGEEIPGVLVFWWDDGPLATPILPGWQARRLPSPERTGRRGLRRLAGADPQPPESQPRPPELLLEEALAALNASERCREHSIAITHIETALLWLEKRRRDRSPT